MEKEVTITWPIPKCKCGVHGDLLISMEDFNFEHVWCKVCGERLESTKEDKKEDS